MDFLESELKEPSNDQTLKYLLNLIRRWPKLLIFLIISLLLAVAYNRYITPVYLVQARISTSKFSQQPYNPVPGLVDANFFLKGYSDVFEEIPMLKSWERIESAVSKIDYHVSYYSRGLIKTVESARGIGFDVVIDSIQEKGFPSGIPIFVNQNDRNSFRLNISGEKWKALTEPVYQYGQPILLGTAIIRITNTNGRLHENDKYYFTLNPKESFVNDFRNRLTIEWVTKGSSMLDFKMESEVPERDIEFLTAFYEVTAEMGLRDKNQTLDNTINFIADQMDVINDSVLYYQRLVDNMKLENVRLNLGTDYIFSIFAEQDKRKAELSMQESYLHYLEDYFQTNNNPEEVFAPSVLELNIPLLEEWVGRYISQRLNDRAILNRENALNPLVAQEDSLKRKLIKGIYESIASTRERNKDALKRIERESNKLYASVKDVQFDFRELTQYQRMLQLNVGLFDLFLKRRTEAAISKASATSDYKIIDKPGYSSKPLRPNKLMTFLIAGAIGLFLPIIFFLFRDITSPFIQDKDELQAIMSMPLLGSIPHSPYPVLPSIAEHPRSVVTESFRAVRANLKFIPGHGTQCLTLVITSSVAGEGKTFCSVNLAQSLVLARKKTLLIGADMRKPNFKKYLNIEDTRGLSEYLAGIIDMDQVVIPGDNTLPDIISSGTIPPNPAELLVSPRMATLMEKLKKEYDFIVIDTSPIGLVSDAMELLRYSDYNLFVVRQGVTHKAALRMISELYVEGKIKNFTMIFNDVSIHQSFPSFGTYVYGMGYQGYGYGYYEEDNGKGKRKRK